ncbi:hypothetical protein, unlikely [Trypanosoma brucei gambiense DAL972]|uniref:Uncharacterized protein n=1 Tax=Trypanosoma brucei gambiense (strain MHOM/CI/86/DAL972) TaxID=679716 RepID=C9ZVE1_TRYB9|nr:hypothetical protein, unlikely [Trypanosoma brucei gambiense DAL972]CBH13379.1 hypothetical protein, unlikely [Trypanosoma brucei gambiense DAL972]|eukprot:XP_011775656.1 hypothetical protein, unlikely [Trypanosoma brucei gambiense DAL972]
MCGIYIYVYKYIRKIKIKTKTNQQESLKKTHLLLLPFLFVQYTNNTQCINVHNLSKNFPHFHQCNIYCHYWYFCLFSVPYTQYCFLSPFTFTYFLAVHESIYEHVRLYVWTCGDNKAW